MKRAFFFRRAATLAIVFVAAVAPLRSVETALVEYDIEGTAKFVDVTWNKGGITEQKQLKLPIHESFRASVGSLAYCSAQKVTVYREPTLGLSHREIVADGKDGTVHVSVRINFKSAGEATSDVPYGIAKV